MIKLKGEVADICRLLLDDNKKICNLVEFFIRQIDSKNKDTLYNLIPEALNRLSDKGLFPPQEIESTISLLLKYITDVSHTKSLCETLFTKLCEPSNTQLLDRNIAFCISCLTVTEKNYEDFAKIAVAKYERYREKLSQSAQVKTSILEVVNRLKSGSDQLKTRQEELRKLLEKEMSVQELAEMRERNAAAGGRKRKNQQQKPRQQEDVKDPSLEIADSMMDMDIDEHGQQEVAQAEIGRKRRFDQMEVD